MQRYEENFSLCGFYAKNLLFEMLIVFQRAPTASPTESMLDKKTVAEVLCCNLVFEGFRAVRIGFSSGGLNQQRTVFLTLYTRVIQRIDINGQSLCMFRQLGAALHHSVALE